MFELHHLTALELLDWLRRGEVSPRELTDHYLERIARLDPELGAFAAVTPDQARERADAVAGSSKAVTLWGLPTADKDLVARAGAPFGLGSRVFAGNVAEESDEWWSLWLRWGRELTDAPVPEDADERRGWIDDVVSAFCARHRVVEKMHPQSGEDAR